MQAKTYSIDEFCSVFGLSRSSYYRLRKAGAGPRVAKIGGRVVVPAAVADKWLAQRTEAST
ncbi:helix-turn-helix domain-containing protein [Ruegeria profundi]|nr:helix-turn-helix domain-containing protein [Ruegeria profundi]